MKYKQGGDISVGDWVKHKRTGMIGEVEELDPRCGMLYVRWDIKNKHFWNVSDVIRPKGIRPAEPEELI